MDCAKIGALMNRLRKEKGLTQKNIADALGISNKTVSKWECGMGCPDLSYWNELSTILGVEMTQMLEGEITMNKPDIGKIKQIRFYVCPTCGNILTSTGSAAIFCCGRKLEPLIVNQNDEYHLLTIEDSDHQDYITMNHPMDKSHYISFVAQVLNDRITLVRLYPEQAISLRFEQNKRAQYYFYCTQDGLYLL